MYIKVLFLPIFRTHNFVLLLKKHFNFLRGFYLCEKISMLVFVAPDTGIQTQHILFDSFLSVDSTLPIYLPRSWNM